MSETHPYDVISSPQASVLCWTQGVPVDDKAIAQLRETASLPFVHPFVAVMPDVHVGKGSTVGSVIPTRGAVIPAAVGVDIGCGMCAVRTSLTANDLPDQLNTLRSAIEKRVPHGRTNNGRSADRGAWTNPPPEVLETWQNCLAERLQAITEKHPKATAANELSHLGTLGTGNHFIELCLDEQDQLWVMLHLGSRGIGNRIGTYFIQLAKREMERFFIQLPQQELAYLPEGTQSSCLLWRSQEAKCSWRKRHPEDAAGRRLRAAIAKAKQPEVKSQLPRPPPAGIPWEELEDEMSPQPLVIASVFVRLVLGAGRDEIVSEVSNIASQFTNYSGTPAKDAMGPSPPSS